MSHVARSCYACGRRTDADRQRCDCGEPLWVDADVEGATWPPDSADPSVWRYAEFLPYDGVAGLGGSAGGTPLVRAPGLDVRGVTVRVKYEGAAPTGSFKDRGSAVGVAHALETGARAVGTVSHGNMAMSTAAHAASVGLDCVVCVPDDIPEGRLGLIAQYDPTVVRVSGDYGRLYDRSLELGRVRDVAFVNSDAPMRVAGQKTTALEILEAFHPEVPDALVVPVSSGGHASGCWQALRELDELGALPTVPRLFFVQTAACAPIAEAYAAGDETVTAVEGGETVAYSIANASPPSGNRALAAARDTGGGVVADDDDEILAARERLAREAGLCVEASSATSLAAVDRLREAGDLDAGDSVVAVATGSGFKEFDGAADARTVETDLDGLDETLAATLG